MVVISTFVIFDIETTGLPRYERNRTKITELTFLAVDTRDIKSARIVPSINKLSYMFNPQRPIQREVSELTGLTNAILANQPIFKNRIGSLNSFLEELPKPVCLVAHNGNSFDFKILRSEYIDANATLPPDLLCVDSLWIFKKILKETNLCHKTLLAANSPQPDNLLTDDEDWPELNTSAEELEEIDKLVESLSNISPFKDGRNIKSNSVEENSSKNASPTVVSKVVEKKPQYNICCTLQALYKRLLDKDPVNAHRSEGDCLMLLECMVALKDHFLPCAYNKYTFNWNVNLESQQDVPCELTKICCTLENLVGCLKKDTHTLQTEIQELLHSPHR